MGLLSGAKGCSQTAISELESSRISAALNIKQSYSLIDPYNCPSGALSSAEPKQSNVICLSTDDTGWTDNRKQLWLSERSPLINTGVASWPQARVRSPGDPDDLYWWDCKGECVGGRSFLIILTKATALIPIWLSPDPFMGLIGSWK